jgi:hypothetical protein
LSAGHTNASALSDSPPTVVQKISLTILIRNNGLKQSEISFYTIQWCINIVSTWITQEKRHISRISSKNVILLVTSIIDSLVSPIVKLLLVKLVSNEPFFHRQLKNHNTRLYETKLLCHAVGSSAWHAVKCCLAPLICCLISCCGDSLRVHRLLGTLVDVFSESRLAYYNVKNKNKNQTLQNRVLNISIIYGALERLAVPSLAESRSRSARNE